MARRTHGVAEIRNPAKPVSRHHIRLVPFLAGFGSVALLATTLTVFLHGRDVPKSHPVSPANTKIPSARILPSPASHPWEKEANPAARAEGAIIMALTKASGKDPAPEAKMDAALILSKLTKADLPVACKLTGDGNRPEREWLLRILTILWADLDGPAAMEFARTVKLNPAYKRQEFCRDLAAVWGFRDAQGLKAWIDGQPKSDKSGLDSFTLTQATARRDPAAAAKIFCEQTGFSISATERIGPYIKTPAELHAVRKVLAQYPFPPATITVDGGFALRGNKGSAARDLQEEVEHRWPKVDPEGWAEHLRSHPLSATGYDLNIAEYAPHLSSTPDPNAAADQLLRGADKLPRAAALQDIITAWAKADINAAGAWLNTLRFDADTVPAVNAFARAALNEDPAAAFKWLDAIPDPVWRESSVAWLYENWHLRDAAAATAWIENAGWTPERKRSVAELMATRAPAETGGWH